MTTYRILSDNCSLGAQNKTVESDALEGLNVQALVEGGHIVEVVLGKSTKQGE